MNATETVQSVGSDDEFIESRLSMVVEASKGLDGSARLTVLNLFWKIVNRDIIGAESRLACDNAIRSLVSQLEKSGPTAMALQPNIVASQQYQAPKRMALDDKQVAFQKMDTVMGRSLLGADGLSTAFLQEVVQRITNHDFTNRWEALEAARKVVQLFEPLLAEHLSDAVLAGWVTGYDNVAAQFPAWLQKEFTDTIRRSPPSEPPSKGFFSMFDREPELRLLNTENATKRLMERNILTRPQFDAAKESAQRQAFTIAGDLGTDTINRMRDFLNEDIASGTSLESFKQRVEENLGASPIAPGHLENVYRTNLQSAYRDGRETLRSNPIVAATFPYQEYFAVHDGRARSEHRQLEKLGLNGTGIYRVDDPFWEKFTPPNGYQCRCGTRLLTLLQASHAGVHEAQEWMRTARAPIQPEFRYAHIPFAPTPGFGSRGNVGVIVMSSQINKHR